IRPAISCPLGKIQLSSSRKALLIATVAVHGGNRKLRTASATPVVTATAMTASNSQVHRSNTVDSGSEASRVAPAATKVKWRRWFIETPRSSDPSRDGLGERGPPGESLRSPGHLRPERGQPGAVRHPYHAPAAAQQGQLGQPV